MIALADVHKVFRQGETEVRALAGVSLDIAAGEFVAVRGPSGSGKSTLLHLIGGLDLPSGGEIRIDGALLSDLSDDELTIFRRRKIGVVFQFFNLLPTLSAEENVALPLLLDGIRARAARSRAAAALERVGLAHRRRHRPDQLSGGEMQRAAVARALVIDREPRHGHGRAGAVADPRRERRAWLHRRPRDARSPRGRVRNADRYAEGRGGRRDAEWLNVTSRRGPRRAGGGARRRRGTRGRRRRGGTIGGGRTPR